MGCAVCGGTGYKGRLCINEVLVVDARVRAAILKKASAAELKDIAVESGMIPMLEDGLAKAARGETTIEEVLRATA